MKLNEYYVCDAAGYVKQKVKARTLINEIQSNGNLNWTLKNLYGKPECWEQSEDEMFCHKDCWVDPDAKFKDKVREGAEEAFDFFMKHGYHMKGSER